MQIYVNEQPLEATLSGENNLAEIYNEIESWAEQNGKYLLSIAADGEELPLEELSNIATESVERVDLYLGDELDMVLTTISELDRYVDQVGSTLFEQERLDEQGLENLHDGVEWIESVLESVCRMVEIDIETEKAPVSSGSVSEFHTVSDIVGRLSRRSKGMARKNDREEIHLFIEDLRGFKFFVMRLEMQLKTLHTDPAELMESVRRFSESIPQLIEQIVSINADFQAGKDLEALDTLDRVTIELNRAIAALFALDRQLEQQGHEPLSTIELNGIPFSTRANELTELLRELSSALEENDIVATGDILEYELTGSLAELRPYLEALPDLPLPQAS